MTSNRLGLLFDVVARHDEPGRSLPARVCFASVETLRVTGAALALVSHDGHGGTLAATDALSGRAHEQQFTLGEGPALDVFTTGSIVVEPDLKAAHAANRWPAFAPEARASGIAAAFGFPLWLESRPVGALCLYRDLPGPMDDGDLADAASFATIATMTILAMQHEPAGPADYLHRDIEAAAGPAVVHQATGMAMAQLGVTIAEASVVLRAHAFAHDRLLVEVAADVVARRLRFS